MIDSRQRAARRRKIARLERRVRPLLAAYESRWSGRLFAVGLVGGSLLALATGTPPWGPVVCLFAWPLTSAILCAVYLTFPDLPRLLFPS